MDPPSYANSSSSTALSESYEEPFLVNLVPSAPGSSNAAATATASSSNGAASAPTALRSDGVSFQCGPLGAGPSVLQGEVQLKILSPATEPLAPAITKVEVIFRGVERNRAALRRMGDRERPSGGMEIELVEHKTKLWDRYDSIGESSHPPSVMPFKIDLTPDLPHCIHLGDGAGLEYELEAKVHCSGGVSSGSDMTQSMIIDDCVSVKAPVHLVRYSKRGEPLLPPPPIATPSSSTSESSSSAGPSLSRTRIPLSSPTPLSVTISKTLLRRGEPVGLKVRIPPPTEQLMREKGLQLRSVRAELRRHIRVRKMDSDDDGDDTATVVGTDHDVGSPEADRSSEAPPYQYDDDAITELPPAADPATEIQATSSAAVKEPLPDPVQDDTLTERITVLAFSGKSCRFSQSRPVVLHPRPLPFLFLRLPCFGHHHFRFV